jgi:hypothetical protein
LALERNDQLKRLFEVESAMYRGFDRVIDQTTYDADRIYLHHSFIVTFEQNISFELEHINGVVETVETNFSVE